MRNKQTNKRNKLLFSIVLLLFTVPSVLAAPAPSIYLNQESINLNCGESTIVEVRINTSTDSTMAAQADIHFDPECVNITEVDYTGASWYPTVPPGWSHCGNYVRLGTMTYPGVSAGDYLFARITIECVACCNRESNIGFTRVLPDGTNVYNGTITCRAGDQPQCLGDCFNDTGALVSSNVPCYECLDSTNPDGTWENYEFESPCAPDTTVPRRSYEYCPQCCDGEDNDDDDILADWPVDPECACCLDETEDVDEGCPGECVPELPTLALGAIGILGAILMARKRE